MTKEYLMLDGCGYVLANSIEIFRARVVVKRDAKVRDEEERRNHHSFVSQA